MVNLSHGMADLVSYGNADRDIEQVSLSPLLCMLSLKNVLFFFLEAEFFFFFFQKEKKIPCFASVFLIFRG